jgi:hypothetical protein
VLWLWSYDSWIYNYLCNQCLSQLSCELEARSWQDEFDTTWCDKVSQWLVAGQWFSPGIWLPLPQYNWNIVESGVKHPKP